jgi:hypothetical protein
VRRRAREEDDVREEDGRGRTNRTKSPRARVVGGRHVSGARAGRGLLPRRPTVAAIEGRLVARDEDIQDLIVNNQRTQQLIAAQHELRAVSVAATRARAEREGEVAALA